MAEYRAVITKALLHARLVEIIRDGATTSLSEVRNLEKLNIPETLEEKKKLDGVESDLLLKNARVGITSTQLLLSRLRKTDGPGEAPAPAPILGHADVLAIVEGQRTASMTEIEHILHSEQWLSTYQQEKLKAMLRTAYAKIVRRTGNYGVIPADPPTSETPGVMPKEQEDIVPPEFAWVGRRKPKKER